MVFRTATENEFIEPYSADHKVYAVFKSQRNIGQLPWSCTTDDIKLSTDVSHQLGGTTARSGADLKTLRLAQSVTAVYFWINGRWDQLNQWNFWPVTVLSFFASVLLVIIMQNMLIAFMK